MTEVGRSCRPSCVWSHDSFRTRCSVFKEQLWCRCVPWFRTSLKRTALALLCEAFRLRFFAPGDSSRKLLSRQAISPLFFRRRAACRGPLLRAPEDFIGKSFGCQGPFGTFLASPFRAGLASAGRLYRRASGLSRPVRNFSCFVPTDLGTARLYQLSFDPSSFRGGPRLAAVCLGREAG